MKYISLGLALVQTGYLPWLRPGSNRLSAWAKPWFKQAICLCQAMDETGNQTRLRQLSPGTNRVSAWAKPWFKYVIGLG